MCGMGMRTTSISIRPWRCMDCVSEATKTHLHRCQGGDVFWFAEGLGSHRRRCVAQIPGIDVLFVARHSGGSERGRHQSRSARRRDPEGRGGHGEHCEAAWQEPPKRIGRLRWPTDLSSRVAGLGEEGISGDVRHAGKTTAPGASPNDTTRMAAATCSMETPHLATARPPPTSCHAKSGGCPHE